MRPIEAWKNYRLKVYKTDEPLPLPQERECSLAFYAGMMEALVTVSEISASVPDDDAGLDAGSDKLEAYYREIEAAAAHANLNRSTGQS